MALTGLVLTGCSSDEKWNTASDVTIEMAKASMTAKENKRVFNVPVEVKGVANGPISFTVEVNETGTTPAKEDVNYYVTSKTVNIPVGVTEVNVEVYAVNDKEINNNRTFAITIVKAEGASIGGQKTTDIVIIDDDDKPYEAIQGVWTLSYLNYSNSPATTTVLLNGVEEGEYGYGKLLYMSGLLGDEDYVAQVWFDNDEANDERTLKFTFGQVIGKYQDQDGKEFDVIFCGYNGQYLYPEGDIYAEVNAELTEVTFDPQYGFFFGYQNNGWYLFSYDCIEMGLSMTRE